MSLLDDVSKLPDDNSTRGGYSWYGKLDQDTRKDVDEFIQAFWDGKLTNKFRTICKASTWLAEQVSVKCNLNVKRKTVEDFMRTRRP